MSRVLIALPDRDFDVTEVAVPWRLLTDEGHDIVFATERGGHPAQGDPRLLSGVILGQLGAAPEARRFYAEMIDTPAFAEPMSWEAIDPASFDGLILPGGHAPGMRQYLDGAVLHDKVAEYWSLDRPVGAICHGVLILARATDKTTGRSLIHRMRTTCLPKYMERTAYYLTAWRLGRYYRTYPAYTEDEVRGALDDPDHQFVRGPMTLGRLGSREDPGPAFVVQDGRYVSARWPGDAYAFAERLSTMLHARARTPVAVDGC